MEPTTDLIPEAELALQLGAGLDTLRKARTELLTEGEHWERVKGEILLNSAGIEILVGAGFQAKKKEGGAAPDGGTRRTAIVVAWVANKTRKLRAVKGRVKDSGEICTVVLTGRGVLSHHFRRGDELACEPHSSGQAGHYQFDGKPERRRPL